MHSLAYFQNILVKKAMQVWNQLSNQIELWHVWYIHQLSHIVQIKETA